VNTARHHELLANAGGDYGQGHLFSAPLSADQFERLLKSDPFAIQDDLNI